MDCKLFKTISWYCKIKLFPDTAFWKQLYQDSTAAQEPANSTFPIKWATTISEKDAGHVPKKYNFTEKFDIHPFTGVKKELLFDHRGELRNDSSSGKPLTKDTIQGYYGCINIEFKYKHKLSSDSKLRPIGTLLTNAYTFYLRMRNKEGKPSEKYKEEQYAFRNVNAKHWIFLIMSTLLLAVPSLFTCLVSFSSLSNNAADSYHVVLFWEVQLDIQLYYVLSTLLPMYLQVLWWVQVKVHLRSLHPLVWCLLSPIP